MTLEEEDKKLDIVLYSWEIKKQLLHPNPLTCLNLFGYNHKSKIGIQNSTDLETTNDKTM